MIPITKQPFVLHSPAENLPVDSPMPEGLLDEAGVLRLLPAADYDAMNHEGLRVWCHRHGRYGLPTVETVAWLRDFIGGRRAIEIGAGAGDLCHHLGIQGTDSKIQEQADVAAFYAATRQPVIRYPHWVKRLEAREAIRMLKPQVVVASWVTEWCDPRLPPPSKGASMYGVKEDRLLDTGVDYVLIGNRTVHGHKAILARPHEELRLPFLRSRSARPEEDRIYVWRGTRS